VSREVLPHPNPADWSAINHIYDERRFSPLNEISRGNIATGAWRGATAYLE
jgi:glucose dehydrogenase